MWKKNCEFATEYLPYLDKNKEYICFTFGYYLISFLLLRVL